MSEAERSLRLVSVFPYPVLPTIAGGSVSRHSTDDPAELRVVVDCRSDLPSLSPTGFAVALPNYDNSARISGLRKPRGERV
jgi:hypothetical protein